MTERLDLLAEGYADDRVASMVACSSATRAGHRDRTRDGRVPRDPRPVARPRSGATGGDRRRLRSPPGPHAERDSLPEARLTIGGG